MQLTVKIECRNETSFSFQFIVFNWFFEGEVSRGRQLNSHPRLPVHQFTLCHLTIEVTTTFTRSRMRRRLGGQLAIRTWLFIHLRTPSRRHHQRTWRHLQLHTRRHRHTRLRKRRNRCTSTSLESIICYISHQVRLQTDRKIDCFIYNVILSSSSRRWQKILLVLICQNFCHMISRFFRENMRDITDKQLTTV